MGKAHAQEYILQLQVELEWMEQRLQMFRSREPVPASKAKAPAFITAKLGEESVNIAIPTIEVGFSMSIQSTYEDLERFEQQRKWLDVQGSRWSGQVLAHLIMITENDIEEAKHRIEWQKEYEHHKGFTSYNFDQSTKAEIIAKYDALILQWKEKIGKRSAEAATLEKTGGTFNCEVCNDAFKSKGAVTTHVNKAHLEVALQRIDEEERRDIAARINQNEAYKVGFVEGMAQGRLGRIEVERIASLPAERRAAEKRKNDEASEAIRKKENEGTITDTDYDANDLIFDRSHLFDQLDLYDEQQARGIAQARQIAAWKKMQLFIFRKEVEPALAWMKAVVEQMNKDLKFGGEKDRFVNAFGKMFKGAVPSEIRTRIDEIFGKY